MSEQERTTPRAKGDGLTFNGGPLHGLLAASTFDPWPPPEYLIIEAQLYKRTFAPLTPPDLLVPGTARAAIYDFVRPATAEDYASATSV